MAHHKGHGHGYHAQHGHHQKKMHEAHHKHVNKEGKLEMGGNLPHGEHGEGLGNGYNGPDHYHGTEDGHNSHCC